MSRSSHRRYTNQKGKRPKRQKAPQNRLPRNAPPIELSISHIGGRGDGVGEADYTHNYQTKTYSVFVPNSLPGEILIAQPLSLDGQGIQAEISELKAASAMRKAPDCDAFPQCGGCQFQHMDFTAYQNWKAGALETLFAKAGLEVGSWRTPFTSQLGKRRRARLAFRRRRDDVILGFRMRASHQIVPLEGCVVLAEGILTLLPHLQTRLLSAFEDGMTGEVDINLCDNGCDVTLHLDMACAPAIITALGGIAAEMDIARLSLQEPKEALMLVTQKTAPRLRWPLPDGASQPHIDLMPAASSFLQADSDAEFALQSDVFDALSGAKHILDLFCGSGTLSAALLFAPTPPQSMTGYDTGEAAVEAYQALADNSGHGNRLKTATRNLYEAPLTPKELEGFDAVIIDPPRSGAQAQITHLAQSDIPHIMMVSCNPHSFARDAKALIEGGYSLAWARHVDQFLLTPHSEVIASFTKEPEPAPSR